MIEIIICDNCKGRGTTEHSELLDSHRGEYKVWDEKCRFCEGSGRMQKTTTIKFEPYKS